MAFQGLTPESLLDRSDSKNPATTCKGLTASGRPCRRGLGSTPGSSPNNTPTRRSSNYKDINGDDTDNGGVVAIIDSTNAAAFFCWQHKDQAQNLLARIESQQLQQQQSQKQTGLQRQRTRIIPLHKRSSIDTLVERVGIIDLDEDDGSLQDQSARVPSSALHRPSNRPENVRIRKREALPLEWQGIQGPLMSVPEEVVNEVAPDLRNQRRRSRSRSRIRLNPRESRQEKLEYPGTRVKPKQKASWSCCGLADNGYNDDGPPVRRRERYDERRPSRSQSRPRPSLSAPRPASYIANVNSKPTSQPAMQERAQRSSHLYNQRADSRQHAQSNSRSDAQLTPVRQRPVSTSNQPGTSPLASSSTSPPHSLTSHFLSLIPQHLDPTTTSALLTELSKPFAKDDDAGYIYIYWLTPSSSSSSNNLADTNTIEDKPDDDIASTILDSDSESDESYRPATKYHRHSSQQHRSSSNHRNHTQTKQALLTRYASIKHQPSTTSPTSPPKILLKIGRATNVHRRMTQWSKQCDQNITLIRYYPYKSTSIQPPTHTHAHAHASSNSQLESPSGNNNNDGKVPHVNKVERLIHIELRGLGMGYDSTGKKCEVCGRGHREWFEVEGTRKGLREVDGVVRRWIAWGLREDDARGVT